jgi:hypothetical protein
MVRLCLHYSNDVGRTKWLQLGDEQDAKSHAKLEGKAARKRVLRAKSVALYVGAHVARSAVYGELCGKSVVSFVGAPAGRHASLARLAASPADADGPRRESSARFAGDGKPPRRPSWTWPAACPARKQYDGCGRRFASPTTTLFSS